MNRYLILIILLVSLPLNAMELGLPTPGIVDKVHVSEGQEVSRGQALVSLDKDALLASRQAAKTMTEYLELKIEEARREFERNEELYDRGQIADREYQNAKIAFAQARSELATARAELAQVDQQLRYSTLRAPSAGKVSRLMAYPGMAVSNRLEITPLVELTPK